LSSPSISIRGYPVCPKCHGGNLVPVIYGTGLEWHCSNCDHKVEATKPSTASAVVGR
jgi:ribosomal protein L37AE/L43A